MAQSMTGFARWSVSTADFSVTIECRSVNSRYLDIQFRIPESLRSLESQMRSIIGKFIARGKIEVQLKLAELNSSGPLATNPDQLKVLRTVLSDIHRDFPEAPMPDQLALLLAPGVLMEREIDPEMLKKISLSSLSECVKRLSEQRQKEGENLKELIMKRCNRMHELLQVLHNNLPKLREAHRKKLIRRLNELEIEADSARFEEELLYVIQRADVDEEMDRLGAHLGTIHETLQEPCSPCGRKLDFIMQELNREANTLASKSSALSTTNISVELKVIIEQMREQIQNIE